MDGAPEEKKGEEPEAVEVKDDDEPMLEAGAEDDTDEEKENKVENLELVAEEADLVKKVGFAKLMGVEGLDIEYTIKKYEIFIGRKSKSTPADVVLGSSMSISRKHAKISYNFEKKTWELSVLGKNGVSVGKILYAPSSPPVPLKSQELIQFGDKLEPVSLYFLLPIKEPEGEAL